MYQCFFRLAITALLPTYVVKCAEIISGPMSQVVTVGQNASFECKVEGFGTWYINGQAIDPLYGESAFESKGFYSSVSEDQDETTTTTSLVLRAEGRKENNGSKIQCYGYDADVVTSVVALLIVYDVTTKPTTSGKGGILCNQSSPGGRQGVAACTPVPVTAHEPTNISVINAGATNAGATNAGATNAGATNAGATNAGATNAGVASANSVQFQDYASSTCAWSPENAAETLAGLFAVWIIFF